MEFSNKVPSTLIRQSKKLVFEPPDGIKASLQRTYKTVLTAQRTDRGPTERSKLHFMAAWLHAIIQERLRYTPIGWTKVYEFNEADQRCSIDLIDELLDSFGERNNIPIEKIPWDAIRTILAQNLYGGKVDNEYDNKILKSLVDQYFSPKCFDRDFQLFYSANEDECLYIPEAIKTSQYIEWIDKLPAVESPAWSGLPVNVEKILKETQAIHTIKKLWEIQDVTEEDSITIEGNKAIPAGKKQKSNEPQQIQWLKNLGERVSKYLSILPANIEKMNRTSNSINNPLFRFLEREVTVASKLLDKVRTNLTEIKNFCEGKIQSTSEMRKLAKELHSELIPVTWKRYTVAKIPVTEWITDFKNRLIQFSRIIPLKEYQKQGVLMGGLLYPEAYLTATRQYVAQNEKWSLEELDLQVSIYENEEVENDTFLVQGMFIEGANWDRSSKKLVIREELSFSLPILKFKWIRVEKSEKGFEKDDEILVPVYLNRSRVNLLFSIKLKVGGIQKTVLYQKGLALIACDN